MSQEFFRKAWAIIIAQKVKKKAKGHSGAVTMSMP